MFGRTSKTWQDAIEDWTASMVAAGRRPSTIYQRRWQLRRLAEAYVNRSPWRLTTTDLARWLADQGWGVQQRKSARAALRGFYAWATKNRRARRNPAADLDSVPVPRGLPRPAMDSAVSAALDRANDKVRLMILLAWYAGLRVSEIASLRWDCIDGHDLIITGKGGHTRRVPLHMELAAELATEWARRQSGSHGTGYRYVGGGHAWVFPGQSGGGMSSGYVSHLMSRALRGPSAHQLRHGFATRLLAARGNLLLVQQALGHSDVSTTQVYAQLANTALRSAIDAL